MPPGRRRRGRRSSSGNEPQVEATESARRSLEVSCPSAWVTTSSAPRMCATSHGLPASETHRRFWGGSLPKSSNHALSREARARPAPSTGIRIFMASARSNPVGRAPNTCFILPVRLGRPTSRRTRPAPLDPALMCGFAPGARGIRIQAGVTARDSGRLRPRPERAERRAPAIQRLPAHPIACVRAARHPGNGALRPRRPRPSDSLGIPTVIGLPFADLLTQFRAESRWR
jgi:hypothetical protein